MRALHIKLLRNLWTLKGQGVAIAAVIATGVAMYVMSLTALESLRLSQDSVYQNQRFAHVFANLKRAPQTVAERLREIPGIATLETRVQVPLNIQLPHFADPVTGLAVSIPNGEQPQLNRLYLRAGQLPDPNRDEQIVISEAFAEAHSLHPGDAISVVINGRLQRMQITGIALSPEYIYQIRPGDLFPDFSRYAIVWMNRDALEVAYGMEGAFNNVVATVARGHSAEQIIAAMDLVLETWGGLGAYDRADQISHRYLEQELASIEGMAIFLPLIFLGVAAFLLNVVAARLIRTQREQVAVLKAFGYSRASVAGHYLMLVLVVVLFGSLVGVFAGTWLASALASLYQDFFRFPWLEFRLRPSVALSAILIAGGATVAGTLSAVQRAFALPAAEAMRPEPPARYRRTLVERLGVTWLSQPSRMILRNIERQPIKAGLSVLGIAFAVAMMMLTLFQRDAIDHMLDVQFGLAQRQDVTVTFTEATSSRALYELNSLPGVTYVEGFRSVPAILRYGHREYRGALQGYEANSQLNRVLDETLQPVVLPKEGVLMTDMLANMLGVGIGDRLQVFVQEGRRPALDIPVSGLVTEFMGVGVYLEKDSLTQLLGESDTISGAFLAVQPDALVVVSQKLEEMPRIASIAVQSTTREAIDSTMEDSIMAFTFFAMLMSGSIAFAVVYNNARIAFAERGREMATLRVLGLTKGEVAFTLLGELLLLTFIAMPVGFLLGYGLGYLLTIAMATDLYRIPLVITAQTYATAAAGVLIATVLSALIVSRSLIKLDMVSALKAAE